ncbi:hypothetical protein CABS01_11717 [Colletotrichum abscissum]|uniref:uncharacterized protein n=1 Tax=Colletotrichum abscissum TaxID=1671311 RepID=UPI0027D52AEC|nr:uncharacterized protein CABS01_11717 [Colletotrichum abscissum]KAK1493548.1 hypothetical protein CABS01_11717 [Colletotrichum abscissum]
MVTSLSMVWLTTSRNGLELSSLLRSRDCFLHSSPVSLRQHWWPESSHPASIDPRRREYYVSFRGSQAPTRDIGRRSAQKCLPTVTPLQYEPMGLQ